MALSLDAVNRMDYSEFISAFGSVIEHGILAAACVWDSRPFASTQALQQAFSAYLQTQSPQHKPGVIRCYPDLAGKLSQQGRLTEESQREHAAAGLLEMTAEEKTELESLNARYKAKFQFPFVISAMENKKATIMREIKVRMGNSVLEEVEIALSQISRIAAHRINSCVYEESSSARL